MQACNELFLGGGEDSPTAMYHLSNGLKYVRERLESEDALADSTMGLVISLITQEQVRSQHKAARVHMDGLVRMIEMRGGLESLETSLPLVLKTCKYVQSHLYGVSLLIARLTIGLISCLLSSTKAHLNSSATTC